nr:hypothetical protein [Mycoplasmopsis bovis]
MLAKVREIENKAEQELKEYSEPAKAKVEHWRFWWKRFFSFNCKKSFS